MKTAIQQASNDLLEQLKDLPIETIRKVVHVMHYHLETEKKIIIDLCTEAYEMGLGHKDYSAIEMYNETFKN